MDKEKIEVHSQTGTHNPNELLSPVALFFPEDVQKTIDHEKAHAQADPEASTKGGEFGYSVVLVKLPNGLVMASWVAWYQPWGEREPEDMMQIAEAPGRSQMSEQDMHVYEQSRKEWFTRLKEKRDEMKEEDPVSILEIIPGIEEESEDGYRKRAEIVIKFSQKLNEMTEKGKLPPMDELIDIDFKEIYDKYKSLIEEAYCRAEDEFNWENALKEELDVPEEEAERPTPAFGIIYNVSSDEKQPDYANLPLAV